MHLPLQPVHGRWFPVRTRVQVPQSMHPQLLLPKMSGWSGALLILELPVRSCRHSPSGGTELPGKWSSGQVVTSPNPGAGYNALLAVASIPGGELWGVGYMNNTTNGTRLDQTLIEHWDGTQWSVVSSPDPGSSVDALSSVVALGVNNVWAVGSHFSTNQSASFALFRC